ncbi:hypothetical protein JCM10207_003074 [Rhodosporidiobolus poonsookiae]
MPARTPPTPPALPRRVFHGTVIHSRSLTETEYLQDALLAVDAAGTIAFVEREVPAEEVDRRLSELGWVGVDVEVVRLKRGEFLIPGFIDTHTHAPQYVNLSYGQQFELLDWLSNVTFPTEQRFGDPAYARKAYEGIVERVINSGTTTCCWYGTLHSTTKILAAVCHRRGQRAFVGKCNMDRNSAPYYQEESAAQSLADTDEFISFVRSRCASPSLPPSSLSPVKHRTASSTLVQPILTPRFAISCSDELLAGLGEMMDRDPTLPCQTHLCENPSEIEFTKSLFPFVDSYTAVYDHFRLLRRNTVLAHCVHLTPSEMDLIKAREAGVAHCPSSNFNLRSGTARVGEMLDRGIKVGLGTDVSGGVSLGILSAIRSASFASKTLAFHARDHPSLPPFSPSPSVGSVTSPDGLSRPAGFFASKHLSLDALFYLATLGGAQVCCLTDRIGNFDVGKEFDAILVRTGQRAAQAAGGEEGALEGTTTAQDEEDKALWGVEEGEEGNFPSKDGEGFNPALIIEPDEPIEKVFEKFLFSGDDRNLASIFVRGRVIGGSSPLAPV